VLTHPEMLDYQVRAVRRSRFAEVTADARAASARPVRPSRPSRSPRAWLTAALAVLIAHWG
jgi:hypothetical protein